MKQKVLTHLEPYRDKMLSFGCEVIVEKDIVEIIGYPLTHADLLRALEEKYTEDEEHSHVAITGTGEVLFDRVNSTNGKGWVYAAKENNKLRIKIPLTHRTIEDIPESDPMWKQLVEVFNLK